MDEKQLAALAALTGGTETAKESKTIDYKVAVVNKKGELRSVGIFKIWRRFSEKQQKQILAKLESEGVIIEQLTGEASSSDDEF